MDNTIVVVILAVLLVLSIYIVYKLYYGTSNGNIVPKQISLLDSNSPIMNTQLTNPTSDSFAFGVWIYVNSWSNNSKILFYLHPSGTNVVSPLSTKGSGQSYPNLSLGLEQNQATLFCTIGNDKTKKTFKNDIKNGFPIQKWTHVVISFDGNIFDSYLDGKLIKSTVLNFSDFVDTKRVIGKDNIYLGDCNSSTKNDIYLTYFNRWDRALDARTVQNLYLSGNGKSMFSNFNVDLNILKDGVTQNVVNVI
jgi:hypothetical protein